MISYQTDVAPHQKCRHTNFLNFSAIKSWLHFLHENNKISYHAQATMAVVCLHISINIPLSKIYRRQLCVDLWELIAGSTMTQKTSAPMCVLLIWRIEGGLVFKLCSHWNCDPEGGESRARNTRWKPKVQNLDTWGKKRDQSSESNESI